MSKLTVALSKLGEGGIQDSQVFTIQTILKTCLVQGQASLKLICYFIKKYSNLDQFWAFLVVRHWEYFQEWCQRWVLSYYTFDIFNPLKKIKNLLEFQS